MRQSDGQVAERGQILVIFAGGLVAFLMFMGLVIDGGMAFLSRRDTQNQADLAALSGTKVVLDSYIDTGGKTLAEVQIAVTNSLWDNGCDTSGTTCTATASFVANDGSVMGPLANYGTIPGGAQGVKVDVARQTPTFILGAAVALLNGGDFSKWNIGASATALTGSNRDYFPGGPMLPIALREPTGGFNTGQYYELQSGHTAPGNFSWLDFDSVGNPGPGTIGASMLGDWVCQTKDSPAMELPQLIEGKPGLNLSSESRKCIENYIKVGATLLFPVYPDTSVITNRGSFADYPISSVVSFEISGFDAGGSTGLTLFGHFQEVYSTGYVPEGPNIGAPDPNATSYFLGLIK